MRLQHLTRRKDANDDGTIVVGSTKYEIDENGFVDVSDEHGAVLLQNVHRTWVSIGGSSETSADKSDSMDLETPVDSQAGGLDGLTKRELLDYAISKGISDVNVQMSKHTMLDIIKEHETKWS